MNPLIEGIRPLINDNIPTEWIALSINHTPKFTDAQKDEAMTYLYTTITGGDLGEEQEEIEFVPLPEPAEAPVQEPSPEPAPAEPVPA